MWRKTLEADPNVRNGYLRSGDLGRADELGNVYVAVEGVSEHELLSFCAQHLDGYKCPRGIFIKNDLPHNVHDKIIRPARALIK